MGSTGKALIGQHGDRAGRRPFAYILSLNDDRQAQTPCQTGLNNTAAENGTRPLL